MSNTAKRLLEIMNKFSSPSKNARKVGNDINSILKIPALTQNQKRFSEEDLVNRVNPYGRPLIPQAKSQSPISLISKSLQIFTMSQLLQLKRLQTSTETVKKIASKPENQPTQKLDYKLPNQPTNPQLQIHRINHPRK
jgi:nuclear pore complex protein Nup153